MMTQTIGSEEEVHVRRTITNLRDDILRMEVESTNSHETPIYSGSKAEGLRFESSDDDWMLVHRYINVITSYSHTTLYDCNNTLLMMENEMTKPGFTLLRMINYPDLECGGLSPVVDMLNGRFVSSKRWREIQTCSADHIHPVYNHGPCTSFGSDGCEVDYAFCLKCDKWPTIAQSSIQRLHQSTWPKANVIQSIVSDGVLFVAIGAKKSFFEDNEWRMSFSLAEKRLIHSMNHAQFLCYALLKLFLKEAIDEKEDVKGLLCSYFLKTALFWEITASPNNWNPSSLLPRFWKCFCRLLQWVRNSYCPNFFIPENNMFEGKIEGTNRDKLLHHLGTLYQEGYRCLLRMTSFTGYKISEVLNGLQCRSERESCKVCVAKTIIEESEVSIPQRATCFSIDEKALCLQLQRVMHTTNNSLERLISRQWLYKTLKGICLTQTSQNMIHETRWNKSYYKYHEQTMEILNRCRTDSACHYLYQATTCYNVGKYSHTLTLAKRAKKAIFSQRSMFRGLIGHRSYREAGYEDLPIETVMRTSLVDFLCFQNIPEFEIENFCTSRHKVPSVPPSLYAMFLEYLCYSKLGHQQKRDKALQKMYFIIHFADWYHINKANLYTSLQILGLCQQMNGDDRAALRSYVMSLSYKLNHHKLAAYIRLGTILAKYF